MDSDSDSDSDYSDDEGIYDLSPDEDELLLDHSDEEDEDEDLDSEEDELDDLGDRIQEITYSRLPSLVIVVRKKKPQKERNVLLRQMKPLN